MKKRRHPSVNCVIVFEDGRDRFRLIICPLDARWCFFLSHFFFGKIRNIFLNYANQFIVLQTAEIIALLYEATQDPNMPLEQPALNPTGGVKVKPPMMLDYKKDPTRPGGGVFVAHDKNADLKDVPEGTIISPPSGEAGAGGNSQGEVASLVANAAAATSVSLSAANYNDRARAYFSSSPSPFAPLPRGDLQNGRDNDLRSDMGYFRNGIMPPISAVRSPLESQQQEQAMVATGANAAPLVNLTPLTAGARAGHYMNVNPAMNLQAQNTAGNVQVMNVLDAAQGGANLASYALADTGFLEGLPGGMFDWGTPFIVYRR